MKTGRRHAFSPLTQSNLTVLGTGAALAVRALLALFATSRLCVLRSNDVLVQRRIRFVRRVTWRTIAVLFHVATMCVQLRNCTTVK